MALLRSYCGGCRTDDAPHDESGTCLICQAHEKRDVDVVWPAVHFPAFHEGEGRRVAAREREGGC